MLVRLIVSASGTGMTWQVDEWNVLIALGALSAEPETMTEFFDAVRRYQPRHRWDETGQAVTLDASLTREAAWCLIDLTARSVVTGGKFKTPGHTAAFEAEPGDELAGGSAAVWLDVPTEWLFQSQANDWRFQLAARRKVYENRQRLESRTVLFGRPLLEFITVRVLSRATTETPTAVRNQQIRAIHANWLMTRRDDLLGHTPREVLLECREQIDADLQHRSEQWSTQGFAPWPLDVESAAYRFGGYGTNQVVVYFDLVRALLVEAWQRVIDDNPSSELLRAGLANFRDGWLDQPPEDGSAGNVTCRELIESERRRLPVVDDENHIDCKCPICQALAAGAFGDEVFGAGPMFVFYDGHHMEIEDEFAFSLTASREEWVLEREAFGCDSDWFENAEVSNDQEENKEATNGPSSKD